MGSLYAGIAAAAPGLYCETAGLFREAPTLVKSASLSIGPKLDAWIDAMFPSPSLPVPSQPKMPALGVRPHSDGSYAVDIGDGVDIVQVDARRMRIEPHRTSGDGRVRATQLLADANDHFINYVKANGAQSEWGS